MFTRSIAALLSGMSEDQIKNFSRSDRAPSFLRSGEDLGPGRWTRYSARDIVLIALAERLRMQIGYAEGLRPDTAAKIAAHAAWSIEDALASTHPIWAGYVGEPLDHTDRGTGEDRKGGYNVAGTLPDISAKIASMPEGAPVRLFLVNVTEVIREVRARAKQHAVHLDLDALLDAREAE